MRPLAARLRARGLDGRGGLGRAHPPASASSSASEKPPTVIAPEGHSAAQMPQPRQLAWSTSACGRSPSSRRTAPWGQTLTQTAQPMQTSGSEKATSTGVTAIPPWSIEVTRAAAALAWAMVSGMPLGPCAVPAMKIPARCEFDRTELGVVLLQEACRTLLEPDHPGDLGGAVRRLEAGGEDHQVEELLGLDAR